MSNWPPQYFMSEGGSNNSGQHVSQLAYAAVDQILTPASASDPLLHMTTPVIDPDSEQPVETPSELSNTVATTSTSDTQHLENETENTGATIEIITVEKYKRTDGFANPYHIQGLNASTPDDVDDEDDEEDEELEAVPLDTNLTIDPSLELLKGEMTVDTNEPDELTLRQEIIVDEELSIVPNSNETSMPVGSLPTSNDSSVTSVSPVTSVASSFAPAPQILPRNDLVNVQTAAEPKRILQFTIARVPSEECIAEQQIKGDFLPEHPTPPVSRVTPDSSNTHETPSDAVNVEEAMVAPDPALPTEPTGSNWMTPATNQADLPLSTWNTTEVAPPTAATSVAPVANSHVSNVPTTDYNFAVGAPTVPIISNMVPQPSDLTSFQKAPPRVPVDLGTSYTAVSEAQPVIPTFSTTAQNAVYDRGSTPSPGPPTQPSVPSPPPPQIEPLPHMTQSIDGSPPVVGGRSDDVEIRFRRARFLEKREQWIYGGVLVVDTFRREEPATRPEINLPDPTFPLHCTRCTRRNDGKSQKIRTCRCGNLSSNDINKILERYMYKEHKFKNHGFIPERNKRPAQDHFDYPETIAVVQSASQLALIARNDNGNLGAAAVLSGAGPDELRNHASLVAAAVASVSGPSSTQVNMSCTLPPSNSAVSPIALRRNRLQRNNSHCFPSSHSAQSSPSSFNAKEYPEIDKLAAMAAATAVSMTAALSGSNLGDRGIRNDRISESEVEFQPVNPPTSPASGILRTSNIPHPTTETSVTANSSVPPVRHVDSTQSSMLGTIPDHGTPPTERRTSLEGVSPVGAAPAGVSESDVGLSNTHLTHNVSLRLSHPEPTPAPAPSPALPTNGLECGAKQSSPPPVDLTGESQHVPSIPHQSLPQTMGRTVQSSLSSQKQQQPQPQSQPQPQPQPQHGQIPQITHPTLTSTAPPKPQQQQQQQQQQLLQQQHQQQQSQQQQKQASLPQQQQPPQHRPQQPSQPGSGVHFSQAETVASMGTASSLGNTFPHSQPVASSVGTNATEAAIAAAYAACGLMLQSGFNLPIVGSDSPAGAPVSATPNLSNNASTVNYLDQYRMQQVLPLAHGSAAARPDTLRQSIESSINKTMEVVRVALITQCRDYSEALLYEVKQLKEELRSRGEECQNAVETVSRLREQIERDRAIIRENVPPERLLQLGHPYSTLVTLPSSSSVTSGSINEAGQATSGPPTQATSLTPSQQAPQQTPPQTHQSSQQHPQHQSE